MEKEDALKLLNEFRDELIEFKKILLSSKHPTISKIASNHELINEIRFKLQSMHAELKTVCFEFGDKPSIEHGMPASIYDAYEAALEDDNGILFKTLPALELITKDLIKVRKKLLLVDKASFHEFFNSEAPPPKAKSVSLAEMFRLSFLWFSKCFNLPFNWLCNFILKHTVSCLVLSALILVLISFIV